MASRLITQQRKCSAQMKTRTLLAAKEVQRRLNKALGLLETFDVLASLRSSGLGVERRTTVSRAEFLEIYYCANRLLVIRNLLDDWPAMRLWNSAYLKDTVGDAEVEIMAGRDANLRYDLEPDRHRRSIRFPNISIAYIWASTPMTLTWWPTMDFQQSRGESAAGRLCTACGILIASAISQQLLPMARVSRNCYAIALRPLQHSCDLGDRSEHFKLISPGQTHYLYNEEEYLAVLTAKRLTSLNILTSVRSASSMSLSKPAKPYLFPWAGGIT